MEVLKWLVGVGCRWAVASGGGRTGNFGGRFGKKLGQSGEEMDRWITD